MTIEKRDRLLSDSLGKLLLACLAVASVCAAQSSTPLLQITSPGGWRTLPHHPNEAVEFPGGPSFAPLFHAKGGVLDAASRTRHASARSQQGTPPVTAARNKVPVPLPIPPVQFVTHRLRHSCAPGTANATANPKSINFNVNYHSGIIPRGHAPIASPRDNTNDIA